MHQPSAFGFAYIEQFRCLADKCEDSCCQDWSIRIDDAQAANYRNEYPALYNLIAKDDSGYQMRRQGTHCSANDGGLCTVHRDYGESLLSDTCIDYPRMYRTFGPFYTRAGTMSCPEITRKCLFDDRPFEILETQLLANHKDGQGIIKRCANQVSEGQWQQIISTVINRVLDQQTTVETSLQQFLELAPELEQSEVSEWLKLLNAVPKSHVGEVEPALSSLEAAENTTLLLMVVLEHLDRSRAPEHLRQRISLAFSVLTNHPEPLRCELLPDYQAYYEKYSQTWLQPILKRFAAAEMSRTGFPFISTSAMGKDYGCSLQEWSVTLAIRVLSLRLLLIILATNSTDDLHRPPSNDALVEWVYQFCRKVNHDTIGPHERRLRELAMEENKLAELWAF